MKSIETKADGDFIFLQEIVTKLYLPKFPRVHIQSRPRLSAVSLHFNINFCA